MLPVSPEIALATRGNKQKGIGTEMGLLRNRCGFVVSRIAMVGVMVALVASLIATMAPRSVSAAAFAPGDQVVVIDGSLNLRVSPSLTAKVDRVLEDGTPLEILEGPTSAAGFSWYRVETGSGSVGWVAGLYLAYPGGDGIVGFSQGDTVRVVDGSLNVRSEPGLDSSVKSVLEDGSALVVMDGPVAADGYTWYEVRNFGIAPGWVAGEFLVYDDGISMCEGGAECDNPQEEGDTVTVVTDFLNLRSQPGIDATVLAVLPNGTVGEYTGESEGADEIVWVKITGDFGTGWVARQYVAFE
jgi:uncharacterized protein YgiM (DUF1202 family)